MVFNPNTFTRRNAKIITTAQLDWIVVIILLLMNKFLHQKRTFNQSTTTNTKRLIATEMFFNRIPQILYLALFK